LLRSRVDKLENALSSLRKIIADLEKRIKTIAIGGGSGGGGSGGASQEIIEHLLEELRKLRVEFDDVKYSFDGRLDALEKEMPLKAYRTELVDLENRILDKLREMI
jgi:hypothetical protein